MPDPTLRIHESDPVLRRGSALTEAFNRAFSGPMPSAPLDGLRYRNILLPQMVGGALTWAIFGPLGQAMRIRGADVTAFMCDQFLPACVHRKVDHHEPVCSCWCCSNAAGEEAFNGGRLA